MNEPVARLAAALEKRLAIIADQESRRDIGKHLERLAEVSEQINELVAALPPPVDPRLQHYLTRCSYDKALEFLNNELYAKQSARPESPNHTGT